MPNRLTETGNIQNGKPPGSYGLQHELWIDNNRGASFTAGWTHRGRTGVWMCVCMYVCMSGVGLKVKSPHLRSEEADRIFRQWQDVEHEVHSVSLLSDDSLQRRPGRGTLRTRQVDEDIHLCCTATPEHERATATFWLIGLAKWVSILARLVLARVPTSCFSFASRQAKKHRGALA